MRGSICLYECWTHRAHAVAVTRCDNRCRWGGSRTSGMSGAPSREPKGMRRRHWRQIHASADSEHFGGGGKEIMRTETALTMIRCALWATRTRDHPPWGSNPRAQGQRLCALPTELGGLLFMRNPFYMSDQSSARLYFRMPE